MELFVGYFVSTIWVEITSERKNIGNKRLSVHVRLRRRRLAGNNFDWVDFSRLQSTSTSINQFDWCWRTQSLLNRFTLFLNLLSTILQYHGHTTIGNSVSWHFSMQRQSLGLAFSVRVLRSRCLLAMIDLQNSSSMKCWMSRFALCFRLETLRVEKPETTLMLRIEWFCWWHHNSDVICCHLIGWLGWAGWLAAISKAN